MPRRARPSPSSGSKPRVEDTTSARDCSVEWCTPACRAASRIDWVAKSAATVDSPHGRVATSAIRSTSG